MSRTSRLASELEPSGIRDFFELVKGMDEVISLGVGEPDFPTPWHIRNAAVRSINEGRTNYTSNKGFEELRNTLAEHLLDRHGLDYDPGEELLITTGVSEATDLAMRALINPGDEVILPSPCYISYLPTARMAGGKVRRLKTTHETNFRLTPSQLREAITDTTKILCLNYPSNPTGITYPEEALRELAEVVREHDLLFISDEIYSDLTFETPHVPFATLPDLRNQTVLLNGFSKAYAMTGFRIGYAAGPADVIGTMEKIHQYTMLSAPTPAQYAGIEALVNGDRAVKNMRQEYRERRDLVVHRFRRMGLECVEPDGTFYVFPSIEITGMDARTFCERLLDSRNVAVVPGTAFGSAGAGHVRVSFATDRDRLIEALNRIERFVNANRTTDSPPKSMASE